MNDFQRTLYNDLMTLCASSEAFYYVDQEALGASFRIFLYRLASYTDFMLPNAMECRGHTFRMVDGEPVELASLPMQKFFNNGENPYVMSLDFSNVVEIQNKMDGSLVSTVILGDGGSFCLKTKGSFHSEQAKAAESLLHTEEFEDLLFGIINCVQNNWTVNMEYVSPDNRIVIGYEKPSLVVLNVRDNATGEYIPLEQTTILQKYWVDSLPIPADVETFVKSVYESQDNIEGFIFKFRDGKWVKVKTDKYCSLHKTKDSISSPRRLFEACVNEGADDLRGMLHGDVVAISQINEMEEKVAKIYNHLHKTLYEFYDANRGLDRKSYAILGQQELSKDGIFGLAMNLYVGKEVNLKEFMIKHYKDYGIKDDPVEFGE
jgi:RNA ligase